jgi:hypothetical protein
MTFRVVGLGDATVRFYAYQLIDSAVESTGQKDWQEKLPEDSGYAR